MTIYSLINALKWKSGEIDPQITTDPIQYNIFMDFRHTSGLYSEYISHLI